MRILVIEDEAALRETLARRLTDAGYSVDVAAEGEEGLYAATERPLDVAIVDSLRRENGGLLTSANAPAANPQGRELGKYPVTTAVVSKDCSSLVNVKEVPTEGRQP